MRFELRCHDSSDFRAAWLLQLSQELRKLRAQCERLSLHRAADRIAHYIHAEGVDGCVTLQQLERPGPPNSASRMSPFTEPCGECRTKG